MILRWIWTDFVKLKTQTEQSSTSTSGSFAISRLFAKVVTFLQCSQCTPFPSLALKNSTCRNVSTHARNGVACCIFTIESECARWAGDMRGEESGFSGEEPGDCGDRVEAGDPVEVGVLSRRTVGLAVGGNDRHAFNDVFVRVF